MEFRKMRYAYGIILPVFAVLFVAHIAFSKPISVLISNAGIGGVSDQTLFTAKAISKLLPGFSTHEEKREGEAGEYTVIVARRNDGVGVIFYGNETVIRGDVADLDAVTDQGLAIGAEFSEVYEGSQETFCEPGMEVFSGRAVCLAPKEEQVSLIFAGGWNGPDGVLPPLSEVSDWKLETIIWNAPF